MRWCNNNNKNKKDNNIEEDLFLTYSTHVRFHCLVCPSQVFEEKLFVYLPSFVDNLNYVTTVITKMIMVSVRIVIYLDPFHAYNDKVTTVLLSRKQRKYIMK